MTSATKRMSSPAVRIANPDEAATVATILAAAMVDDPVTTWILRGRGDRQRRLRILFEAVARWTMNAPDHVVHLDVNREGAALWHGIDRWIMPTRDVLRMSPVTLRAGFIGTRALRFNTVVQKAHPRQKHYYLEVLGTLPERQGRGIGGALVGAVLEKCDAQGVGAYLENSNPRNEAFYARQGFEPMRPLALPKGCPPLIPMWRPPALNRGI